MKLPWYDGMVNGVAKVWDAADDEVDLTRYTALIVAAVNKTETKWDRLRRWLREGRS